jgi:Resolvase, N terminal domain
VCNRALGYIRLATDTSEQSARRLQDELAASAEREGYTLGEVFMEQDAGGSSAFAALIDTLTQTKTPVVVVPGVCHFAHLPGLRIAMRDHLERETGARVVIITEATPGS